MVITTWLMIFFSTRLLVVFFSSKLPDETNLTAQNSCSVWKTLIVFLPFWLYAWSSELSTLHSGTNFCPPKNWPNQDSNLELQIDWLHLYKKRSLVRIQIREIKRKNYLPLCKPGITWNSSFSSFELRDLTSTHSWTFHASLSSSLLSRKSEKSKWSRKRFSFSCFCAL